MSSGSEEEPSDAEKSDECGNEIEDSVQDDAECENIAVDEAEKLRLAKASIVACKNFIYNHEFKIIAFFFYRKVKCQSVLVQSLWQIPKKT